MKKTVSFAAKNVHYIIFAAFIVFQAWIMRFIVLFGDDYYYTTFFYDGIGHFIDENVVHYTQTNGRAWVHILDELLLAGGTIWAWRIFNTLLIAFTVFITAKIISQSLGNDRNVFKISLTLACVLFSVINIKMAYQGIYWATGAVNYFLPVPLTLLYFFIIQKYLSGEKLPLAAMILALLCCSSTEQCAFASLCVTFGALLFLLIRRKKPGLAFIFCVAASVIGFVLLFFAPGNFVKTTYYEEFFKMTLPERIVFNLPRVLNLMFSQYGMADILILFLAVNLVFRLSKPRGTYAIISAAVSFAGLFSLYSYIHLGVGLTFAYVAIPCTLLVFLSDTVYFFIESKRTGNFAGLFFTVIPPMLQAAMLVSPEFGARTVLVSALTLFVPMILLLLRSENRLLCCTALPVVLLAVSIPGNFVIVVIAVIFAFFIASLFVPGARFAAVPIILIFCAVLMLDREYAFVCGYRENYAVHEQNRQLISEYIENGDTSEPLTLYYLKNDVYKYTMPYDDPYHTHWFKRAYRIPNEAEVVFICPTEK